MRTAAGHPDIAATAYRHGDRVAWAAALLQNRPDVAPAVALGTGAKFPISATDLMDRYEGPALGKALKEREDRWIASRFTLTADDLRKD
jgi:hypothetical protein